MRSAGYHAWHYGSGWSAGSLSPWNSGRVPLNNFTCNSLDRRRRWSAKPVDLVVLVSLLGPELALGIGQRV
jgi:hypothetical protein